MRRQISSLVLISGILTALALILPNKIGAQEKSISSNQIRIIDDLDEHLTPSRFYKILSSRMADLEILRFSKLPTKAYVKSYLFEVSKDSKVLIIFLSEFDSIEDSKAKSILTTYVSLGRVVEDNKFGDEGRRIYRNGFSSLEFRKGHFTFSVNCDDEQLAELIAGYAVEALDKLSE